MLHAEVHVHMDLCSVISVRIPVFIRFFYSVFSDSIVKSVCQVVLEGDASSYTEESKGFGRLSCDTQHQLKLLPLLNSVICCTKVNQ